MTSNRSAFLALAGAILLAACGGDNVVSTEKITPVATVSATPTTAPATATATSVPTAVPTSTATALPPPTSTATIAPTATSTSTEPPEPTASPTLTSTPQGATALFHADALDPGNPFPSNRLLDETGHVSVTGSLIGADLPADSKYDTARALANIVAEQLKQLKGFSTYAPMRVKFDHPIALPATTAAVVLNCDSGEVAVRLEVSNLDTSGDDALEIYPVKPLLPKTTYVYAVTREVRDAAGILPVGPSPDLAPALAGDIPSLAAWKSQLECALPLLQEKGIGIEDIAAIDVFTTQATTDDLLAIKDLFAGGTLQPAAPVFENSPIAGLHTGIFAEGTPEFTDLVGAATSDTIAAVAVGSFPSYDFRKDTSAFDPELLAGTRVPPAVDLDFVMTVPKAAAPEGGYPLVLFGHGLGGSNRDAVGVAKLFGNAPMMAIGISAVDHGRRGELAQFFNLTDGFATRENFRQSVADMMQMALMARNATIAPFDQVNKDRIHYMGISLGGIMGTLFMGYDPNVRVGMLSVPGGGLPDIIQSNAIGQLLKPLISITVQIPQTDPKFPAFLHRFFHLSQWVIDAGDPINTAPVILDPQRQLPGVPLKRILMHEGVIDDVVPNATTDALALAMGIGDAKASLGCLLEGGCSGIWRFVMTEYGQPERSGHGVTGIVAEAGAQATQFLLSDGTNIVNASPAAP